MLDYILIPPLCFHNAGLTLTEICVCLRAVYVNYVICDKRTTVSMASLSPLPLILHLLQGHCVISTLSLLQPLLALTLISWITAVFPPRDGTLQRYLNLQILSSLPSLQVITLQLWCHDQVILPTPLHMCSPAGLEQLVGGKENKMQQ